MSNNLKVALQHGFDTQQIVLQDDKLVVSDHASKLVLDTLKAIKGQNDNGSGKIVDISPFLDNDAFADVKPVVLAAWANQKIQEKYAQIGGKTSSLGLPINADLGVQPAGGDKYFMDFRGGRIEVDPRSGKPAVAKKLRVMELWWVGLECRIRQEKVDEVYGSVAAIIPGSGMSNFHKFPGDREYWDMGPDGQRIVQVSVPLFQGPPMTVVLLGSLVEHDSGDIEEYKHKIADAIANAARGLAVMAGVPAEATAADQGFINDLSLGLVNAAASALGADDDPYVPQQLRLHWADILNGNYTRQTLRRDDDPRIVEYTHSIVVTGIDQGGDRGEYALYFDVRQFDVEEVA